MEVGDAFMLNPRIFSVIDGVLGPFDIDRFATARNT